MASAAAALGQRGRNAGRTAATADSRRGSRPTRTGGAAESCEADDPERSRVETTPAGRQAKATRRTRRRR